MHFNRLTEPTMRPRGLAMFVACFAVALGVALLLPGRAAAQAAPSEASSPAPAESADAEQRLISNIFIDSDLRNVLQDIALQAGVIIIPDPSVGGLVTAELKEAPIEKALQIVLAGTGFEVLRTPDYYLVYTPDRDSPAFAEVSDTKVIPLSHTQADVVLKMLAPNLAQYVRADPRGGGLAVTAPPTAMQRIVADVALIDRPRKHVMLDARVVVLERTDLLDLGVKWDFPSVAAGLFSNSDLHGGGTSGPQWPWGVRIGYTPSREFTNSLLLTLSMLEQNGEATIVSSPQLMSEDGKAAKMSVTTEEYFQIVSGGAFTTANLEVIESGTVLQILPRVGDDGQISLELAIEVSDVVARGQDDLPVVTRREATTTVRVRSGGTAAIAGLMDSRTEFVNRQVPGAGNLPGLGALFSNDSATNESKQLAVFITATLMDSAEKAPAPEVNRLSISPVDEESFRQALIDALKRINGETPAP